MDGILEYENLLKVILKEKPPETEEEKEEAPVERKKPKKREDQIFEVTSSNTTTALPTGFYLGKLATNWLRDDNEKILLYGALNEAFTYLNEPAQAQLYAAKFDTEIKLLNDEDKTRGLKGGTVTAHYDSHLI